MTSRAWRTMCDRICRLWSEFNHANDAIRKQLFADLDVTLGQRERFIEEMTTLLKSYKDREKEITQGISSSTAYERIEARKLFRSIAADNERSLAVDIDNARKLPYNDTQENMLLAEIGDILEQKEA